MATTIKQKGLASSSSGTEKMKKNTSSNPQTKKTPTKSSSSSSDQKPQKPIPNYLKPTISSSHISTKPATTTTTTTAAVRRNHPIEKPPLPAQTHKAQPPKPTAPQRSVSSLSSKPTKTGVSPTMRRSISAKGSSSSSSKTNTDPKKAVTKTGPKGVAQPESTADDDVAHDKANLDHDKAHNGDQQVVKSDNDVLQIEEQLVDPAMVATNEQVDDQILEKEQEQVHEELPVVIEQEKSAENKNEKEGFESVEGHVDQQKVAEEKDEKVELESEVSVEESKEEEQAAKQTETGKEAQDYNEVIEETATKLMEDNTNKVRALAGAFETVISLQDAK